MIEIITEQVEMPHSTVRRFQKICTNNEKHWAVVDTHSENKIVFKGGFETVSIACYNLNKKYYKHEKI